MENFELKPEDVMPEGAVVEVLELRAPHDAVCRHALALLREKDARIKELEEAQGAEFTCFVGEPHKVDRCPYGDELARLQKEVAEKDADIKRMYAKIDTLQKQVRQYGADIGKKDAEIEMLNAKIKIDDLAYKDLQELYDADVNHLSDHIAALIDKSQTERAEAITEFAERLKAEAVEVDVSMGYGNECWQKAVTEWEIDKIAEEMKGETDGKSDL